MKYDLKDFQNSQLMSMCCIDYYGMSLKKLHAVLEIELLFLIYFFFMDFPLKELE